MKIEIIFKSNRIKALDIYYEYRDLVQNCNFFKADKYLMSIT